jgi:hypothetical protein
MFYFVAGDGAEKEKFFITYGDKQWYFTLDKATELGNQFYNLLKNKKSLTIEASLYESPYNAEISLDSVGIGLLQEVPDEGLPEKAGDIILSNDGKYLFFLGGDGSDDFSGMKVGGLEETFIQDFKSFIEDKLDKDIDSLDFIFSIEESPQLDPKNNDITIIWLLLLLLLILLIFLVCCIK